MNIKDEKEYSPEIAALFCGEMHESTPECEDGGTEHICEESLNHTGSHRCGFCGLTWSDSSGFNAETACDERTSCVLRADVERQQRLLLLTGYGVRKVRGAWR